MILETFFEKFDLFADVSGAVAKMRGLVLHLAVTGRLLTHRPEDAPVSELVNALMAAKAGRAISKRQSADGSPFDKAEFDPPFAVPEHWAWIPLNRIGAMSGGMTPSKEKAIFWDGDINWFSSKDIKKDELTESELKITREATEATNLQVYSPGCLVMVARSGILKHTFPVSILRAAGTVNQDLKVLSPFIGGIERYLQIMMRGMNDFIISALVKTGMTVQSLIYEEFEAQPFPLPPLAEQKRIVAKVDELMALCDRLEAQQQERETRHTELARASLTRFAEAPTPDNLQLLFHESYVISPADLRKSILTLAVQGKLAPQDPDDEPAAISGGQNTEVAAKAAFVIPDNWIWTRLDQLSKITGGFAFKSTDYTADGMRVVRISDFDEFGFQDHRIVRHPFAPDLEQFTLGESNILMAMTGGTVGKSYFVESLPEPMIVNQRVATIKVSSQAVPRYIDILIRSELTQEVIRIAKNSTNDNISMADIKGFAVPLPPLAEQHRIVARVDQLMALVDRLEVDLATARAQGAALFDATVAELTQAN